LEAKNAGFSLWTNLLAKSWQLSETAITLSFGCIFATRRRTPFHGGQVNAHKRGQRAVYRHRIAFSTAVMPERDGG